MGPAPNERHMSPNRIQYFGSWGSYQVPLRPQEPLEEVEARQRESYYVGHFDHHDRLVRFDKYLGGQLEWTDHYTYRDDGTLALRRMIQSNGEERHQTFDAYGRVET